MESEKLLENLFDRKILTILRILINKKDQKLTLQEINKYSKVPLASTFRIINKLLALDIIAIEKTKHLKTYSIVESDKTKYLENILKSTKTFMDEFLEQINKIEGIREVILYGKEDKDKANLLIIGENINNDLLREAVVSIKTKYNFTITYLILTDEQYTQMVAMNLYSGKKQLILQK